jgi:hypothetical protein
MFYHIFSFDGTDFAHKIGQRVKSEPSLLSSCYGTGKNCAKNDVSLCAGPNSFDTVSLVSLDWFGVVESAAFSFRVGRGPEHYLRSTIRRSSSPRIRLIFRNKSLRRSVSVADFRSDTARSRSRCKIKLSVILIHRSTNRVFKPYHASGTHCSYVGPL